MSAGTTLHPEIATKRDRLVSQLATCGFDGALLASRAWFSWATDGRVNRIANSSPDGVATLLVTTDSVICLTNTIEAPRFRDEELRGLGIPVIEFAWFDAADRHAVATRLIRGRNLATDSDIYALGLPPLPATTRKLRWTLSPAEIGRYRTGARLAAEAVESAARRLRPGMTEHQAAAQLTYEIHARGLNPVVTLIAADDRLKRFRHPIPTDHRIRESVMLVSCSELGGLISNLTRMVHFGAVPSELARRHQAVCEVDAAVNRATRPGRTLAAVFADLQQAYAEQGFADEWTFHHQGGSTGYAGREVFATPGEAEVVLASQAFAWNPSIAGTKSEDTIWVGPEGGIEVLTAQGPDWPAVATNAGLVRPGILEM